EESHSVVGARVTARELLGGEPCLPGELGKVGPDRRIRAVEDRDSKHAAGGAVRRAGVAAQDPCETGAREPPRVELDQKGPGSGNGGEKPRRPTLRQRASARHRSAVRVLVGWPRVLDEDGSLGHVSQKEIARSRQDNTLEMSRTARRKTTFSVSKESKRELPS